MLEDSASAMKLRRAQRTSASIMSTLLVPRGKRSLPFGRDEPIGGRTAR